MCFLSPVFSPCHPPANVPLYSHFSAPSSFLLCWTCYHVIYGWSSLCFPYAHVVCIRSSQVVFIYWFSQTQQNRIIFYTSFAIFFSRNVCKSMAGKLIYVFGGKHWSLTRIHVAGLGGGVLPLGEYGWLRAYKHLLSGELLPALMRDHLARETWKEMFVSASFLYTCAHNSRLCKIFFLIKLMILHPQDFALFRKWFARRENKLWKRVASIQKRGLESRNINR